MTMTWGIRIGQKVHITSRVDYQHFKNPKLLCILCKVSHFKSTKKLFQIRFCKLWELFSFDILMSYTAFNVWVKYLCGISKDTSEIPCKMSYPDTLRDMILYNASTSYNILDLRVCMHFFLSPLIQLYHELLRNYHKTSNISAPY